MKNQQKGFIIPLLITIISLLFVGGGTYVYFKNKLAEQNNANLSVSENTGINGATSSKDSVNDNSLITTQSSVKSNVNVQDTSVNSNIKVTATTTSSDVTLKTFKDDKFSISYPKEWIQSTIDTHLPDYITYEFKKKDGKMSFIVVSKNPIVINMYVKGPIPLGGTEETPTKTEFNTRGMKVIKWDAKLSDAGTISNITTYVITKESDSSIVYVTNDTELFDGITLY